jgi:hypothetical protein
MKKMILFTALLVALSATAAMAAGVNVSWGNTCWADAGSTSSLTWACSSNTFTVRMTTSFQPAVDKTNFVAVGVFMEGVTNDPGILVPDWWKMGTCTGRAVPTVSIDASVLGGACFDPWAGAGIGGLGMYSFDTNRTHMNAAWGVVFAVQFRVPSTRTVGTGLCAGCSTPMTWSLNYIQVAYSGTEPNEFLGTAIPGGNQCLAWQGGNAPCARPIPARNTTWGQVKSLYR